jgi:HEAT repeat protein
MLAMLLGVTVYLTSPSEPRFQGVWLSEWVEGLENTDLASKWGTDKQSGRDRAAEAIRHMGTNTLPVLLKMLRYKDSRLKLILYGFCEEHFRVQFNRADYYHMVAGEALELLGAKALPAMPEIMKLLGEENHDAYNVPQSVMANLGAETVLPLTYALTNQNSNVRIGAATVLGRIHQRADLAVPALVASLGDTNPEVRLTATRSLFWFGKQAKQAIPVLSDMAQADPEPQIRAEAANFLVYFSP